jgi:PhnB protein
MLRAQPAAKKAGRSKVGPSKAAPSKAKPQPIPEGFHTITPYIAVSSGEAALEHYEKALGAKVLHKMLMPDTNKVMHACLEIGSSRLFLCDENEKMKAPKGDAGGSQFYLYVADVDASHKQAKAAGMKELAAPNDMFWGDRMSSLMDRFGHRWDLASHVRDVTADEMATAVQQFAKP